MSYTEGARLPVPRPLARLTAPLTARAAQCANHASDGSVRADLIGLERHLERVEGWIADGVLGGAEPNAADLQIGAGAAAAAARSTTCAAGSTAGRRSARAALVPRAIPARMPAGALPARTAAGACSSDAQRRPGEPHVLPSAPSAASASARRARRPGVTSSGASSSSGTSTKRRLVTCSCGSDSRSER